MINLILQSAVLMLRNFLQYKRKRANVKKICITEDNNIDINSFDINFEMQENSWQPSQIIIPAIIFRTTLEYILISLFQKNLK